MNSFLIREAADAEDQNDRGLHKAEKDLKFVDNLFHSCHLLNGDYAVDRHSELGTESRITGLGELYEFEDLPVPLASHIEPAEGVRATQGVVIVHAEVIMSLAVDGVEGDVSDLSAVWFFFGKASHRGQKHHQANKDFHLLPPISLYPTSEAGFSGREMKELLSVYTFDRLYLPSKILRKAILNARRHGLMVVHYSLQSNHIHLVAEALNNEILTRGMRSLTVTFAKGVGKGSIQVQRFHLHVLRTIRETKNAIHYVLFNEQKHSNTTRISEYSSLLNLKEAHLIIKRFAKLANRTLTVERGEEFALPKGRSYLLVKGLGQLTV